MKSNTLWITNGRSRPRRAKAARLGVTATGVGFALLVLLSSCGDPAGFAAEIDTVRRLNAAGGSFVRLLGTSGDESLYDATIVGTRIISVGSIATGDGEDGLLAAIDIDGESPGLRGKFRVEGDASDPVDEVFQAADYIPIVNDSEGVVVGGKRGDPSNAIASVLQLNGLGLDLAWEFGGSLSNEEITGIWGDANPDVDGGVFVGTSDAYHADGTAFYGLANLSLGLADDGYDHPTFLVTDHESSASAVVRTDHQGYVGVGAVNNGSDRDGLLFLADRFDRSFDGAYSIATEEGDEEFFDVSFVEGADPIVLVGSTTAYFSGQKAWLVVILDDTDLSVIAGYAIQFRSGLESAARAVYALPNDEGNPNYWDEDGLFAIAGDGFTAMVMDADGNYKWASAAPENSDYLAGATHSIVPNDNALEGFVLVGSTDPPAHEDLGNEGVMLWASPSEGTSYPGTTTAGSVDVRNITDDLIGPQSINVTTRSGQDDLTNHSIYAGNTWELDSTSTFADKSTLDVVVTSP
mgnify:CR=1 FL=1